jgi:hypothetical protein
MRCTVLRRRGSQSTVRLLRPQPLRHLPWTLAAAGQAISASGGDARKTLNGLIAVNVFLSF